MAGVGCAGAPGLARAARRPGDEPWHYSLAVAEPTSQWVEIGIEVPASRRRHTDFALPAWTPGSYLIRNFTRHVYGVVATGADGQTLPITKLDKQTWRVENGGVAFRLGYRVYADELSVRTSYVDDQLALLNGASLFMYEPGATQRPATLDVQPPAGWSIHTPLETVGSPDADATSPRRFAVASYDVLVDSPLLLGEAEVRVFEVGNAEFEYVFDGTVPTDTDVDRLASDAETVVTAFYELMGDFPFERYVFLAVVDPAGGGGLEHERACAMILRPATLERPGGYARAYGLLAHEFFHLWNVKRIHDERLGPFDYTREVYTDLLWFHEGFTETMEKRALLEAGLTDPGSYVDGLEQTYNGYRERPGRNFAPIAEISRDAWIKAYQPSPAHWNTSVSYYLKGDVIGTTLDAELRARAASNNREGSLPGLFRELWAKRDPKTQHVPITLDDVIEAASNQAGEDMAWFFDRYVLGTEEVDLPGALERLGMEVHRRDDPAPYAGVRGRGRTIASITTDSPAQDSELMIGDELIAIDGQKIESLDALRSAGEPGKTLRLSLFRRGQLLDRELTLAEAPEPEFDFELPDNPGAQLANFAKLNAKHQR